MEETLEPKFIAVTLEWVPVIQNSQDIAIKGQLPAVLWANIEDSRYLHKGGEGTLSKDIDRPWAFDRATPPPGKVI